MKYILFLFICSNVFGQAHIKNQYYLQTNIGGYDQLLPDLNNFAIQLEYGKYNKKLNSKGFGFLYAKKITPNNIPVERYQLSFKQELTVFSSADLISTFKVLGSVNFGYESINKEKPTFDDIQITDKSAFILAPGLGVEYELTPFVLGSRVTYNFLSNYQKFTVVPYFGIKIHLQ
ncbi:conjugative transposon protein TraO [Dyadobacter jejuensis]|uniref:Conjugative transposon protein TraO n=1 Tax=Dyadobacter jejuensis TaxID=1082580 RepID=A0A316ATD1_9BACT|nr:conjugal transfer protein TraO [Dyadobacter jejuensis]PWJ53407.1 conjugative transposon protein TraO [Dyadobacter jejuensis]